METEQRKILASQLINYEDDPRHLVNLLRAYGWDCEKELVTLTKNHLNSALDRYINSKIQAKDLLCWAECIEGREDIAFEPSHTEIIDACISWLVNPDITDLITPQIASTIKNDLNTNQPEHSYLLMQLNSVGGNFYTRTSTQNSNDEYALSAYESADDTLELGK